VTFLTASSLWVQILENKDSLLTGAITKKGGPKHIQMSSGMGEGWMLLLSPQVQEKAGGGEGTYNVISPSKEKEGR